MRKGTVHGVNFDVLAILLRDMAEQGIFAIRSQLDSFSFENKDNPNKIDDQVTSADYAAQKVIVDMITKCFPEAGIIAEENNLQKLCTHPTQKLYFTLDPLDGTRAYVRMQSDGIGSMIGVVLDGEIIGATIADVMTKEIYLLNPATGGLERCHPRRNISLEYTKKAHMRLAMMDDPRWYQEKVANIAFPRTGFFSSISVTNGSIGTNVARIRKNEATAFLSRPGSPALWDRIPVVGISQAMGFVFLGFNSDTQTRSVNEKVWDLEKLIELPETLIIHTTEMYSFMKWSEG